MNARSPVLTLSALLLAAVSIQAGEAKAPRQSQSVFAQPAPACEAGDADEVVVCGSRDRGQRYRIPEELRDRDLPKESSWGAIVREMDEAGRNADSAVGPSGYLKAHREWIRVSRQERDEIAAKKREEARAIERARR